MKKHLTGVALISITAILAVGCGGSSSSTSTSTPAAPAASGTLDVQLGDMTITAPAKVSAGKTKVTATNDDPNGLTHEVVFIRTDTPASQLPTNGKGEASEKGSIGEIADLPAGQSASTTLDLKKGHYALICNLPGHYAAGMYTDLTVQ